MDTGTFSNKRVNGIIISISILMMLIVINLPFKAKPFGDETFHVESKNMALYLKGALSADKVMITKAPGPILFYTPTYMLAPVDATDNQLWYYGVVFTFLIITLSLIMIFRIGTSFFSKEVGLLTVLLFFVFPIHCYYCLGIMAEAPAFFSLTLALYGWAIVYHQPQKKIGWLWFVLGTWFLILNRPNAMLVLGIGGVVVVYAFFKQKEFFRAYGKKLLLSFVCIGAMGLGALQLAKTITGTKSDDNQANLLYYVAHQGRFQFREEPTDFRFWDDEIRADSKDYQNWVKNGERLDVEMIRTHKTHIQVYRDFLLHDIADHPFWFARQFAMKALYGHVYVINSVKPDKFHLGPVHGTMGYWLVILIINAINILLLIGAIIFLFKEKRLLTYWPFWGIIAALLLFHGLTYMEPRYMFPSRVALYLMSAAGLYRIGWIQKTLHYIAKFVFPAKAS